MSYDIEFIPSAEKEFTKKLNYVYRKEEMKRILTVLCLSLITTTAIAKPVKNIDQAIDLVEK